MSVPATINRYLRQYQREGVEFLFRCAPLPWWWSSGVATAFASSAASDHFATVEPAGSACQLMQFGAVFTAIGSMPHE